MNVPPPIESEEESTRQNAMHVLRVYFAEQRWSRLAMTVILVLTGLAGLGTSWGLLRMGVERMWMRYPAAVLIAWGVFLVLVWIWIQCERRYFRADEIVETALRGRDPREAMRRLKESDSTALNWFDGVPNAPDLLDEAGLFVAIASVTIGAVVLAVGGILNVVFAAPVLFAEVFLDAILIGVLCRRIQPGKHGFWAVGLIRRTFRPVALTALALCMAALCFAWLTPGAQTLGEVLAQLMGRSL